MSFSSCYRFLLGLPTATLVELLRGAIAEGETAGVALTFREENVDVGDGLTATVEARVIDEPERRASLRLTATELEAVLELRARAEVTVDQLPSLDPLVYVVDFELPGVFTRDTSEADPRLVIEFPAVTEGDLALAVSGGEIQVSDDLIEEFVGDAIAADPALLGPNVETGVSVPTGGTAMVTSEIYDDEPGTPGYRGHITGSMAGPTTLELSMPGHIRAETINEVIVDTDMTITVSIAVEQTDDEIIVRLSDVQQADVSVSFVSISPLYAAFVEARIKQEVAEAFQGYEDARQSIPDADVVESRIAAALVGFSTELEIPVFTPRPPASADQIDLTTFVPTTTDAVELVLQLEPREDGTPCDAPDAFTRPEGFALVAAEVAVRDSLDDLIDGTEGSTREIQGHDVTVTDLSAGLFDPGAHGQAEGHIWVEGNADVEIDCWPDAGVDFWGPVLLTPEMLPGGGIQFRATTGDFGAEDDTSCEDVDPDDIADLIDQQDLGFENLPTDFAGVGELSLQVTEVDIFAAGLKLFGTFDLVTLTQLFGAQIQRRTFWAHEGAR